MTLLVATPRGVWADRRVSGEARRFAPERKVFSNALGLVAGFCGDNSKCVRASERFLHDPDASLQDLADLSDGLMVTPQGRIYELWGGVVSRRRNVACHGSGFCEAEAFLAGAKSTTDRTIRRLFRYVFRVRTDCGDGIDFRGV